MKSKNRAIGMIICLIIVIVIGIQQTINPFFEPLSWIFGIAVGWAFRETLEEIRKGE